jgi:hypothetical protein
MKFRFCLLLTAYDSTSHVGVSNGRKLEVTNMGLPQVALYSSVVS